MHVSCIDASAAGRTTRQPFSMGLAAVSARSHFLPLANSVVKVAFRCVQAAPLQEEDAASQS